MTTHVMFDGRLQVYRRGDGKTWQCAARVGGERFRTSTKEENLDRAKDVAEEWYLDLRGKLRSGALPAKRERTFGEAAEHYMREARVLAATIRSPAYITNMELRMHAHILPFFGKVPLSEVNRGMVQTYRVQRAEKTIEKTRTKTLAKIEREKREALAKAVTDAQRISIEAAALEAAANAKGRPPTRSTMSHEIVHIRQVLKQAEGMGWLSHLPSLAMPYMTQGKRERRAWFSPEEYKQLYTATGKKAAEGGRRGWQERYADLHDFVLFMANTGLRPDEALRLEFRDVVVEKDYATKQTILVIDVRGKTGVGYCKSLPGAVHPFERLRARRVEQLQKPPKVWARRSRSKKPMQHRALPTKLEPRDLLPTDRLFPNFYRDAFNAILIEEGLKHDRNGRVRTAYSLRHTYISMRLMEGANIHQVANNCRTSVQMIEEHYAAHIRDRIDAAAINVQRPRAARNAAKNSERQRKTLTAEGNAANP